MRLFHCIAIRANSMCIGFRNRVQIRLNDSIVKRYCDAIKLLLWWVSDMGVRSNYATCKSRYNVFHNEYRIYNLRQKSLQWSLFYWNNITSRCTYICQRWTVFIRKKNWNLHSCILFALIFVVNEFMISSFTQILWNVLL